MIKVSREQIRQFRLHTHHLDKWYGTEWIEAAAGACGFQNSPPGAWEASLHNRILDVSLREMKKVLEEEKLLLQAWSFRGAPVVFPASASGVFLGALAAQGEEPWIYSRGMELALDFLQLPFDELLQLLKEVIVRLDNETIKSKTQLDQQLAQWMEPFLLQEKRKLWNMPSMYGNPDKQTVGGAAVSFLLRPCAFMGLVVFGKREGISPTFTSCKNWLGRSPEVQGDSGRKLVECYLHSFGPGTVAGFAGWLGCSSAQAGRLWQRAVDEICPVLVNGKERYILEEDRNLLVSPPQAERTLHLLGGHDPYLDLQDREAILDSPDLQRHIWQTVSNPGAVLWKGEITGMWRPRKKGKELEIEIGLWGNESLPRSELQALADEYSAFRGLKLNKIEFI